MWHRWTHPPLTEMEFCWCVWMRKTRVSMRLACSNSNMLPRLLFRLPPLGRHYWFAAKASTTVWYTCYFRKSLMLIPRYLDITNLLPMPARVSGIPTIVTCYNSLLGRVSHFSNKWAWELEKIMKDMFSKSCRSITLPPSVSNWAPWITDSLT